MNRLTTQGVTYGSCEFMEDGIYEMINKLSAYEDTGLTPEEIKEKLEILNHNNNALKSRVETQYCNALKLIDEAEKGRDYWKAEALKHCAKLGEIKLLMGRSNG